MRVLGHPLHPMLVHFPIALWTLGSACDALTLLGVHGAWPIGWLALAVGSGAALPTAAAGLLDMIKLEGDAMRTASSHLMLMVSALTAYIAALLVRSDGWGPMAEPSPLPILLGGLGFVLLALGGHFGAALVYRHGAGRYKAGE